MWCERCEGARLGNDEHGLDGWLILCASCEQELREDQAAETLAQAEHAQRQMPGQSEPVTRSKGWEWAVAARRRGLLPARRSWRDVA